MAGLDWRIGEYVLEYPIADGKFGTVYKAANAANETFAIKLVPSTGGSDAREKMAAERRGALLQSQFGLKHDLVPKVFDHKPFETFFGIVMEFVDAPQLTKLTDRGPLAHRDAVQYALCIADFLEKAHSFKTVIDDEPYELIVHADLKPDHILLLGPDRIKVLDFGIAKALAKTTVMTTNNWGTLQYVSPERLDSGQINEQVDLWSLGVMLFEMVSGHRPYSKLEHDVSRLDRAIRLKEEPEALPPSCPRALAAIIGKLLAPQLERRYTSAAEISRDLKAFLSNGLPLAAKESATAETIRIASSPTQGMPGPTPRQIPPTDPLPVAVPVTANPIHPDASKPAIRATPVPRSPLLRRAARAAMLLVITGALTAEAVAWVGAEHMRAELDALDARTVAVTKQEYTRASRLGAAASGGASSLESPVEEPPRVGGRRGDRGLSSG